MSVNEGKEHVAHLGIRFPASRKRIEMREGLDHDEKHRTHSLSDNECAGEVDGSRNHRTLKLRNNSEVFLMREEMVQECVVWAIVFRLVLREPIDKFKFLDDCI